MRSMLVLVLVPVLGGLLGCGGDDGDPGAQCGGAMGTVTLRGSPGHLGVFHDRDGAVLSQTAFDAQGMAAGVIPPCGAVTFLKGTSTYFTVTHVMPGETITLRYPRRAVGASRQVSVDFPVHPGATQYAIRPARHGDAVMGCQGFGGDTSPIAIDFNDGCIGDDGTISFLAVAGDGNGDLAYAPFEHVPLASAGPTSVSVAEWRTATRAAAATFANLPDPAWTTRVQFGPVLGGMYGPNLRVATAGLPVAGTHVVVQAMLTSSADGRFTSLMKVVPSDAAAGLVLDGARDFAPVVSVTARDNTDPARPVVSWTTSATPAASDAIAIDLGWEQFAWFVVAPPDQPGELRFPDLPAELRPTTAAHPFVAAVTVGGFSPLPSYAELRRDPLALWFPALFSDPTDTLVFRTSFAGGDYDLPNID